MSEQKFEQSIDRLISSPETGIDKSWERPAAIETPPAPVVERTAPVMPAAPVYTPAPPTTYKDAKLVEIENILEQDLAQVYFDLPPESKQIFKVEGELTARKINALLSESKVAAQKIISLIVGWLSLLPGVNKFFIEQEAKIKTDKILAMKQL